MDTQLPGVTEGADGFGFAGQVVVIDGRVTIALVHEGLEVGAVA